MFVQLSDSRNNLIFCWADQKQGLNDDNERAVKKLVFKQPNNDAFEQT